MLIRGDRGTASPNADPGTLGSKAVPALVQEPRLAVIPGAGAGVGAPALTRSGSHDTTQRAFWSLRAQRARILMWEPWCAVHPGANLGAWDPW